MKILYIHQHFQKEKGATRSYEFSKYFLKQGHNVTLITGTGMSETTAEGLDVISTETKYNQKMSKWRRIQAFVQFMTGSFRLGLKQKSVDVIYATSTPLTVGLVGLALSKVKRIPFVFEVRDVWPDVPVKLGYLKNRYLIGMLSYLEKQLYKHATQVVVLSPAMKENIVAKGVMSEKVHVVENLANNEAMKRVIAKIPASLAIRSWMQDRFVVVHPGTMGEVNGLQHLVNIAREMKDKSHIGFVLIGEGSEKEKLKRQVVEYDLKNVLILDEMPKKEVQSFLKCCDLGAMTVKDARILWDNSANKFFDFLAAGLPVILNYQGWQHDVLVKSGAGAGFLYNDQTGYCRFIEELAQDKARYHRAQCASKQLSEDYDSERLASRVHDILVKGVGGHEALR
ncbi:glycosyltransferase family 4 protein [Listeria newyorkensis]|uniref:Glycosyltransferase family 4 protein n=1 Tax=Listeria newyorkensis TaxID=1497681 RepID=A0A841YUS3_9LIST|nr:glycosyltransferase family 4 protein [Listeria newyorkensis]MBC1457150.1 glycosyltransferase family 4 protein [Listeria newyorkensis]